MLDEDGDSDKDISRLGCHSGSLGVGGEGEDSAKLSSNSIGVISKIGSSSWIVTIPVSYTHLDVYKRQ